VVKVESCTFSTAILTFIAGDALIAQVTSPSSQVTHIMLTGKKKKRKKNPPTLMFECVQIVYKLQINGIRVNSFSQYLVKWNVAHTQQNNNHWQGGGEA
jgi:hypothetical protein